MKDPTTHEAQLESLPAATALISRLAGAHSETAALLLHSPLKALTVIRVGDIPLHYSGDALSAVPETSPEVSALLPLSLRELIAHCLDAVLAPELAAMRVFVRVAGSGAMVAADYLDPSWQTQSMIRLYYGAPDLTALAQSDPHEITAVADAARLGAALHGSLPTTRH
jgi:hypothetical protein